MMRISLFLLLLTAPLQVKAFDWCSGWGAEVRVAAFLPTSHRVREIYQKAWPDYQIELSKSVCDSIDGWASVNWASSQGHAKGTSPHRETKIHLTSFNFGAKYYFRCTDCFRYYLGTGLAVVNLRLRDKHHYIKDHTDKTRLGVVVKSGVQYFFYNGFFLDGFVDYYYQPFFLSKSSRRNVKSHRYVDLSGFKIGLGLGLIF